MTGNLKFFTVLIIALSCLTAAGYSSSENDFESIPLHSKTVYNQWSLLPSVRLSFDPMYVYNDNSDFSGIITSIAEIDILQYRYYVLSLSMDQILDYSDEKTKYFNFHEIQYILEYFNLRREFDPGSLSIFWDHRCSNYINTKSSDDMITRWYGIGMRWETHGMTIGEKGRKKGIRLFNSDNYLNYSLAGRKALGTKSYPAAWTSDFILRYDLYIEENISAYLLGSAEYFDSDQYTWNKSMECGLRFSLDMAEITPYLRYEYITDNIGEIPGGKIHHGAGIRAEAALYNDENEPPANRDSKTAGLFSPELHFTGSYGYYIDDYKKIFRTGTLFALDLLKYGNTAVFINASLKHSSPRESLGMYPAYIDTYYEGGISCLFLKKFFIDPLFRYATYDEGNVIKSAQWDYHLAALRIRTSGMKPGFVNAGIKAKRNGSLTLINNIELEFTGGYVLKSDFVNYERIADSYARWDICVYNSNVLYLILGEKASLGDDTKWTIVSEGGIRFSGEIVMMFYYRNEFNNSEDRTRDISKIYHMIGVGFDF